VVAELVPGEGVGAVLVVHDDVGADDADEGEGDTERDALRDVGTRFSTFRVEGAEVRDAQRGVQEDGGQEPGL
jgi:hypothetical protein